MRSEILRAQEGLNSRHWGVQTLLQKNSRGRAMREWRSTAWPVALRASHEACGWSWPKMFGERSWAECQGKRVRGELEEGTKAREERRLLCEKRKWCGKEGQNWGADCFLILSESWIIESRQCKRVRLCNVGGFLREGSGIRMHILTKQTFGVGRVATSLPATYPICSWLVGETTWC